MCENRKFKKNYNYYNSSLGKHLQINYTYVTGIDFDSNNNMWLANSGADKMLSVWKNDGTWQAYSIGRGDIGSIMVCWDNGCGLSVAYGEDRCRRIDE